MTLVQIPPETIAETGRSPPAASPPCTPLLSDSVCSQCSPRGRTGGLAICSSCTPPSPPRGPHRHPHGLLRGADEPAPGLSSAPPLSGRHPRPLARALLLERRQRKAQSQRRDVSSRQGGAQRPAPPTSPCAVPRVAVAPPASLGKGTRRCKATTAASTAAGPRARLHVFVLLIWLQSGTCICLKLEAVLCATLRWRGVRQGG